MYFRRGTCRICASRELEPFLVLGPMPLANAFLRGPDEFSDERSFPLDVCFCTKCALVQTPDVVDPELLFRNYLYVSRTSDTIAAHHIAYANDVVRTLGLGPGDLVVEVASNDGSLLKCFQQHKIRTLGVEPAVNIAEQARAAGVPTRTDFFSASAAVALREEFGAARAVIANNVLAHVDDPVDFLRGFGTLLADDGAAFIEVPYLGELVDHLEYDTIYHEHLSYFSVTALARACRDAGLVVCGIEHVPVHGGSVRMRAARPSSKSDHDDVSVAEWIQKERQSGLAEFRRFQAFAADVQQLKVALVDFLRGLRGSGQRLAGYGAPAKGNTLLNYCGIGPDLLEFTVDKNALKLGMYTPGMHIPVLPVETLLERRPDCALILAWNFAEEIVRQQQAYHQAGGRFLVPVPRPRVL